MTCPGNICGIISPQYGTGPRNRWSGCTSLRSFCRCGPYPVERISREWNVLSCDVFSTHRDGTPVGTEEFLVVDTESWEYEGVKGK